jgi:hypothetical protein
MNITATNSSLPCSFGASNMIRFARQAGIGQVIRDSHEDENGFHVDTLLFTHKEYSEAEGVREFIWAVRMVNGELLLWNKDVLHKGTGKSETLISVYDPRARSLFMLRDDFDSHIESPRA